MSNVIAFHAPTSAVGNHKSGRNSSRLTPVACSMGKTNSAGTPRLERMSQYQTCDCVVPIRSASGFWPPAMSQARLRASRDMTALYPNLGEQQPENLCRTENLIFGNISGMRVVDKRAFGRRVLQRRIRLGMTQDALAEAVGMKQQSVDNIEHGVVARPRLLREIADVLLTTQEWLLWKEGPEEISAVHVDQNEVSELIKGLDPRKRALVLRYIRSLAMLKPKAG